MKLRDFPLLADENILRNLVLFLRDTGFNVRFVREEAELIGKKDIDLLSIAHRDGRVVITQDSDFGQIVFTQPIDFTGIIFLRPGHFPADKHIETLKALFDLNPDVIPAFLLTAEHKGDSFRIKVRNEHAKL